MNYDTDGNMDAINRHLADQDRLDAQEARLESLVVETVDDLMSTGFGGDFSLNEIMYDIVDDDQQGDLAEILTKLILSKGANLNYLVFWDFIEAKLKAGLEDEMSGGDDGH